MIHDNEPEQKLCTVIEIRYKGEVLFETQLDEIVNDADLVVEADDPEKIDGMPYCDGCAELVIGRCDSQ